MNYIEYLRMRRNLAWFAGVLGTLALCAMIELNFHAAHLRTGHMSLGDGLDVSAIFGLALAVTLIFATIIGGTLSRENETPEMLRTKPFPREREALSFLLTGLAAIVAAFVIADAVLFIVLLDACAVTGFLPPPLHVGPDSAVIVVLGLGVAFMWYALVQAVSAGLRARGGITIGASWACFTILLGLSHSHFLPTAAHELVMVLNVLNPLAYMNSLTSHGDTLSAAVPNSIFPLDPWQAAAAVWTIGVAACAVAAFNWKRLEF